ncbi:hypothetical protein PFHG_04524 [Plasmodium falciparum HB3]|uniref:Uncharacterized protein n=1 Tax=Plasmodium falciparum (isolate HB3) TaxID=137071 RepID=A0A0L7KHH0_PLAFX|nr:hypothetical protein PFHG_04524 [Plasmodium falciparum HB3]
MIVFKRKVEEKKVHSSYFQSYCKCIKIKK